MKTNAVIPYAIIAIVGILLVIVISVAGIGQRDTLQNGADEQEEAVSTDPEAIFQSNCAACHGADLSGGVGPDLTKIGGELSEDEIKTTILNGKGSMPAGVIKGDEADLVAKWLSEKK